MKNKKVYIIAEAGVNHNGSIKIAKKLLIGAKKAGADAIKFQYFKSENLVTSTADKANYQKKNDKRSETQKQMLKRLELNEKKHLILKRLSKKHKIDFLTSVFSEKDLWFLKKLRVKKIKIPSGEVTNLPYLEKISLFKKKEIFLSTGMANLREIKQAYKILNSKTNKVTVLHCITDYPAKYEELNMRCMINLKKNFGSNIGYSDHSLGNEAAIIAVTLGAKVIEKHITLNKKMIGPDHKCSMNLEEFNKFIESIRLAEKSLGDYNKFLTKSEKKNIKIVRKSIVASKVIEKGQIITKENITCKRPGFGISPMKFNKILGRKAKKRFLIDELIDEKKI